MIFVFLCIVLVKQSCLTLWDHMDCSPPGSSIRGILQARILEWAAVSFSRGSSQSRDRTWVSCVAGRFFTIWATYLYYFTKYDHLQFHQKHTLYDLSHWARGDLFLSILVAMLTDQQDSKLFGQSLEWLFCSTQASITVVLPFFSKYGISLISSEWILPS